MLKDQKRQKRTPPSTVLCTTDFPVVYIDHLEDKNKRRHKSQGTMDLVTCVGLNSVESITFYTKIAAIFEKFE